MCRCSLLRKTIFKEKNIERGPGLLTGGHVVRSMRACEGPGIYFTEYEADISESMGWRREESRHVRSCGNTQGNDERHGGVVQCKVDSLLSKCFILYMIIRRFLEEYI